MLALMDINSMKESAARAQQMLEYEEAVAEIVQDPLFVLDASLKLQRANPAFCRVFGCAWHEARGRPLEQVVQGRADYAALAPLLATSVGPTRTGEVGLRPASGGSVRAVVNVRRLPAMPDAGETIMVGLSGL
jgi:PAS domain S-box-containing protein